MQAAQCPDGMADGRWPSLHQAQVRSQTFVRCTAAAAAAAAAPACLRVCVFVCLCVCVCGPVAPDILHRRHAVRYVYTYYVFCSLAHLPTALRCRCRCRCSWSAHSARSRATTRYTGMYFTCVLCLCLCRVAPTCFSIYQSTYQLQI